MNFNKLTSLPMCGFIAQLVERRIEQEILISVNSSLRSWRDFARECFCFGSEAVNASGDTVRGLVKSPLEFPPAQIRGVF